MEITAKERAKRLVDQNIITRNMSESVKNVLKGSIRRSLEKHEIEVRKDQDKITRHACAENINNIDNVEINGSYDNDYLDSGKVHNTIMNTKTV